MKSFLKKRSRPPETIFDFCPPVNEAPTSPSKSDFFHITSPQEDEDTRQGRLRRLADELMFEADAAEPVQDAAPGPSRRTPLPISPITPQANHCFNLSCDLEKRELLNRLHDFEQRHARLKAEHSQVVGQLSRARGRIIEGLRPVSGFSTSPTKVTADEELVRLAERNRVLEKKVNDFNSLRRRGLARREAALLGNENIEIAPGQRTPGPRRSSRVGAGRQTRPY